MWDSLRTIVGEVSSVELVLVGIIFSCVLGYTWAPRLGEAVFGLFDEDEE